MAQYSVQPGDNPSKIATNFGMRVFDWWCWGRPVAATYGAICITQPLTVDQAGSGHIGFHHAMNDTNVWLLNGTLSLGALMDC
jgi:hypothetical protein